MREKRRKRIWEGLAKAPWQNPVVLEKIREAGKTKKVKIGLFGKGSPIGF